MGEIEEQFAAVSDDDEALSRDDVLARIREARRVLATIATTGISEIDEDIASAERCLRCASAAVRKVDR